MRHTHKARSIAVALLATLASTAAFAGNYDVYGGRGNDTQTIHYCGWTQNTRMDYMKQNSRNVRIVQTKLADLGYYTGAIDGVNGRLTKNAIRNFQATNGHQLIDGIVGIETSAGIAFQSSTSQWVRDCRRPYDRRTTVRYYPITARGF